VRNNGIEAVSEPGAIVSGTEAPMNGLRQLGWPHYWLLTAILCSLLAILGVVLFAGPLLR
jgi:hypothetical protein